MLENDLITDTSPLIHLDNIGRTFFAGEMQISVLREITLTINQGEFVAIMGASGSGKSTLMNLIGGLDYPSSGHYFFKGRDIAHFSSEELAALRREYFGFIFQRYHLLNTLTAQGNVEVPAIYSGITSATRSKRAQLLLTRLGLKERISYFPTQLSGGQQQRVSIARALMNGGEIILADEPTGALDSQSGEAVLEILQELNREGHTIIMVTHDDEVAKNAKRIIEIKDGKIINDRENLQAKSRVSLAQNEGVHLPSGHYKQKTLSKTKTDNSTDLDVESDLYPKALGGSEKTKDVFLPSQFKEEKKVGRWRQFLGRVANAFQMAVISMKMQRLRTFLTMLGIIIGIASVVLVIALGRGTTAEILSNIRSIGTSTLTVYPGQGFGDRNASRIHSLRPSDVDVLKELSFVHSVTPVVSTNVGVRYQNLSTTSANLQGVGYQFFEVEGYEFTSGVGFDEKSENELRLEAVIDQNTVDTLFPHDQSPIGEVIMLGHLPVQIIGVATSQSTGMQGSNMVTIWVPYSTLMKRMLGQSYLRNITIRTEEGVNLALAEKSITDTLTLLHGKKDFFIFNADTIKETIEKTTLILRILVTSIALISLLVGGIGVMNIMLVSVAERTREIGMRMAVGARESDVSQQFLIEAILVCLLGGVLGLSLAFSLGFLAKNVGGNVPLSFSTGSIVLAFFASFLIGLIFGYFPAKRASQLAPIEALERS